MKRALVLLILLLASPLLAHETAENWQLLCRTNIQVLRLWDEGFRELMPLRRGDHEHTTYERVRDNIVATITRGSIEVAVEFQIIADTSGKGVIAMKSRGDDNASLVLIDLDRLQVVWIELSTLGGVVAGADGVCC